MILPRRRARVWWTTCACFPCSARKGTLQHERLGRRLSRQSDWYCYAPLRTFRRRMSPEAIPPSRTFQQDFVWLLTFQLQQRHTARGLEQHSLFFRVSSQLSVGWLRHGCWGGTWEHRAFVTRGSCRRRPLQNFCPAGGTLRRKTVVIIRCDCKDLTYLYECGR